MDASDGKESGPPPSLLSAKPGSTGSCSLVGGPSARLVGAGNGIPPAAANAALSWHQAASGSMHARAM